jgi:hypothetical protein
MVPRCALSEKPWFLFPSLGELSVKNPWEELESCLELWIDCGLGLADCGLFPLGCGDLWTDPERK